MELIPLRSSIHMHTYASDGSGSLRDICEAASHEGLDCIVITDHETLGHNINGYAGDILVITGEEITPQYREQITENGTIKGASSNNHILALGLTQALNNEGLTPQEIIDLIDKCGGMSFIAHPNEPGHPWEDWSVTNFTGLEIWTYKAAWKVGFDHAQSKTFAWRNPDCVLAAPNVETLKAWDKHGKQQRMVGLGCADNHSYISSIDGIERTVFSWNVGLTGIVSYVLVEPSLLEKDPVHAFLDAIRKGRVIIAHDGLAVAKGITIRAKNREAAKFYWPGDNLDFIDGTFLEIFCPQVSTIYVFKDGALFHQEETQQCEVEINGAGVWRVEVHFNGRPWIYANPFYVGLWK
jgi:hypothetical protein